jgi:hypothetical protein
MDLLTHMEVAVTGGRGALFNRNPIQESNLGQWIGLHLSCTIVQAFGIARGQYPEFLIWRGVGLAVVHHGVCQQDSMNPGFA